MNIDWSAVEQLPFLRQWRSGTVNVGVAAHMLKAADGNGFGSLLPIGLDSGAIPVQELCCGQVEHMVRRV